MKPSVRHSDAEAELLDAMQWYDDRQAGLGLELMQEVERAVKRIESDPGIGASYRNSETRFFRVSRFPYVIYYEDMPEQMWIAAIAHERRHPGYWKRRKPE